MVYQMKVGALKRAARAEAKDVVCASGSEWARRVACRLRVRARWIERGHRSEGRDAAMIRLERAASRFSDLRNHVASAVAQIDARKPDADVVLTFATHYVAAR